jgi:hypothetical protein
MNKDVIEKTEVEEVDEINIASGMVAFDDLSIAAEAAQSYRKRFLLVCDATSSMQSWWNEAQLALKKAVDEIATKSHVPFQVKVVAYRDHTCDPQPVVESTWSNDTDYLKDFIKGIQADGGGDFPESIGFGLAPAVQSGAKMVVLIGDAPGRDNSTGFAEAKLLGSQGCPVYALYVDEDERTVESFKQIALLSGGKAMHLRDAKHMTDIFSALLAKVVFQIVYQPTSIEAKKLVEGL